MIRLENVSKYYRTASSVGLGIRKVNLRFQKGEFVVITGESGSGKSTLLNIISGLDQYEEGEMYLFGEETSHYRVSDWEQYRAKNIGFVFQNYNIIESYTVLENILLALELQGYEPQERKQRALELIQRVGLEHRTHHKAGKLSGGEKQRTVIARALAKDARVIVCDEPTGNLDSSSSKAVLDLIYEISQDKLVILVTHNYDEVKDMATRRIRLRDGEVIEDRQLKEATIIEDFTEEVVRKEIPFSVLLISAFRNLFATPKRLFFVLSLQVMILGIFLFIYAYLMYSSEVLIGELANEKDSSHQIELIRRDEEPILNYLDLADNDLVRSVVTLNTVYSAYQAIGTIEEDGIEGSYSLGEINMDDAAVLNVEDLSSGTLPEANEIILNELVMELYDLQLGDEVSLLKTYAKFTRSIGDTYTISGTTLRGNNKSVYFNHSVFTNQELALDGLIAEVGKRINYFYLILDMGVPISDTVQHSTMSTGKFVFDASLPEGEIRIPSHLYPDPMEKQVTGFDITVGPYYGELFVFDVDMSNVVKTSETHNNIYLSTSYQQEMIDFFFGDDYQPNNVIFNVHDITDGKAFAKTIDHTEYRVYYDVVALSTRTEIMTQSQFTFISYVIVFIVGSLLYMILGVVLRNINHAKNKDFAIFRSIGANKTFLAKLVIVEQIISGVIAFGLVLIVFSVLSTYNYLVAQALGHIAVYQYILLFILSIVLSVQVARTFNKHIFKFSVISSLNNEMEGLV